MFLSVCRSRGLSFRIVECKLDRKLSKPQQYIKPLTLKRTLTSSSREMVRSRVESVSGTGNTTRESLDSIAETNSSKHSYDRRSRSFSGLDSTYEEDLEGSIPRICVQDTDNFNQYHQSLSPDRQFERFTDDSNEDCPYSASMKRASSSTSDITPKSPSSISKSRSETDISKHSVTQRSNTASPDNQQAQTSKMNTFFKKTKAALGNTAPRLRGLSATFAKDGGNVQLNHESTGGHVRNNSGGQVSSFKSPLQKLNEKITSLNQGSIIPDFKNKIQTAFASPKFARRKPDNQRKIYTEEEKMKMRNCKTRILEL